jgi:hypothetical protein
MIVTAVRPTQLGTSPPVLQNSRGPLAGRGIF